MTMQTTHHPSSHSSKHDDHHHHASSVYDYHLSQLVASQLPYTSFCLCQRVLRAALAL
jgi:hypothetical protein